MVIRAPFVPEILVSDYMMWHLIADSSIPIKLANNALSKLILCATSVLF